MGPGARRSSPARSSSSLRRADRQQAMTPERVRRDGEPSGGSAGRSAQLRALPGRPALRGGPDLRHARRSSGAWRWARCCWWSCSLRGAWPTVQRAARALARAGSPRRWCTSPCWARASCWSRSPDPEADPVPGLPGAVAVGDPVRAAAGRRAWGACTASAGRRRRWPRRLPGPAAARIVLWGCAAGGHAR